MTTKEITLEWFDQVWNQGNEETIHRLMDPECEIMGLDLPARGPEGFLAFYRSFRAVFDSIHIDIFEILEENGAVAGHGRLTGIHKASGRPIDNVFSLSAISRNGRLVEARNVVDYVDLLSQMGLLDKGILQQAFDA